MSSRLERLLLELHLHLLSFIPRPTDLQSLCPTSKVLRVPATTALYRSVSLSADIPGWRHDDDEFEIGVLYEMNSGLRDIRALTLCSGYEEPAQKEKKAAAKVLKALPQNFFANFPSDCNGFLIDEETAMLVLTRQERLTHLALSPVTFDLATLLKLNVVVQAPCMNLKSLTVPATVGGIRDFDVYQHIIEHAPLKNLTINTTGFCDSSEEDLTKTKEGYAEIASILFSHTKTNTTTKAMSLESFLLNGFSLRRARYMLRGYINLSLLQSLILYNCPGAGKFIRIITALFKKHGSQLQQFEFTREEGDSLGSKATENFLGCFNGLKHSVLIGFDGANGYQGLRMDALKMQGGTVEKLLLHPEGTGNFASSEMGIKRTFFSALSRACPKLRELTITLPIIHIQQSTEDEARSYGSALRDLLDVPDLKLLRILNWPCLKPHFFSIPPADDKDGTIDKLNEKARMSQMDDFVQNGIVEIFNDYFEGRTTPVLAFKSVEGNSISSGDHAISPDTSACYIPVRQRNVFGRAQTALQKVSENEVWYIEPECGLLSSPE